MQDVETNLYVSCCGIPGQKRTSRALVCKICPYHFSSLFKVYVWAYITDNYKFNLVYFLIFLCVCSSPALLILRTDSVYVALINLDIVFL